METVRIMLPVLVMLAMGYISKRTKFLPEAGMEGIKKYIVFIALPATIFHSMGIAQLDHESLLIAVVMFMALSIAMVVGFIARPILSEPYKEYLPFLVTVFEGGMFAYPLYQNLCGNEHFVNIVIVDIAGCIFGFGIYYGIVAIVDQKQKFNVKLLAITALHSPTFWGMALGLILNVTGLMGMFLNTSVGGIYVAIKDMIVAPLTAMILLYVGYSLKIDKSLLGVCIKTIIVRVITIAGLCMLVIMICRDAVQDKYMLAAFIIYFIATPTLSLPSFLKDKEAAGYAAMTISLYVVVTVVGYALVATILF